MHYIRKIQYHAETRPDVAAISQKSGNNWRHLSWQQLWQELKAVAAQLDKEGVKKGDRVAIFADNSLEWTIIDFACIYLGVVSVPIYATSSPKQVSYILNHSGAKFLFMDSALTETFNTALPQLEESVQAVTLGQSHFDYPSFEQWQQRDLQNADAIAAFEPQNDDLLTIIYTSGTTGDPKGVMLTHGNLMAAITAHLSSLNFTEQDRSLAVLPLSHVFERGWTFIALYAGAHNHYVADVNDLQPSLQEVKPHVFCAVPRIYEKIHTSIFDKARKTGPINQAILAWANARVLRNQQLQQQNKPLGWYRTSMQALAKKLVGRKIQQALGGCVRFMPCGGAALDPSIHGFFMGLGVNVKIGYGMTETLATVSFMPDSGYKLGTLGKPMNGLEISIDPAESEILVRSPSMTPGYYKNPEATKALFKDGWIRTGDGGSIDEHGNLVFRERLKELMKTSGGKYIAPQQIEGVLIRERLFEQVAVIADTRKFVSALIVPAWEVLEEYAQSINVRYENRVELLRNSKILDYVEERLQAVQHELAKYERVKKFTLLSREFSIAEGEITPTLKLRRKIIANRFADAIENMYT